MIIVRNVSPYQHIRMISKKSCVTEDWTEVAIISFAKYIKIEKLF